MGIEIPSLSRTKLKVSLLEMRLLLLNFYWTRPFYGMLSSRYRGLISWSYTIFKIFSLTSIRTNIMHEGTLIIIRTHALIQFWLYDICNLQLFGRTIRPRSPLKWKLESITLLNANLLLFVFYLYISPQIPTPHSLKLRLLNRGTL